MIQTWTKWMHFIILKNFLMSKNFQEIQVRDWAMRNHKFTLMTRIKSHLSSLAIIVLIKIEWCPNSKLSKLNRKIIMKWQAKKVSWKHFRNKNLLCSKKIWLTISCIDFRQLKNLLIHVKKLFKMKEKSEKLPQHN